MARKGQLRKRKHQKPDDLIEPKIARPEDPDDPLDPNEQPVEDPNQLSQLERLPCDLIWQIIEYSMAEEKKTVIEEKKEEEDEESWDTEEMEVEEPPRESEKEQRKLPTILNLQLTSSAMRAHVSSFVEPVNSNRFRMVESIRCNIEADKVYDRALKAFKYQAKFHLVVHMRASMRGLFWLRLSQKRKNYLKSRLKKKEWDDDGVPCIWTFPVEPNSALLRVMKHALGRLVPSLHLNMTSKHPWPEMVKVWKFVAGCRIGQIHLTDESLSNATGKSFLSILEAGNIGKVSITTARAKLSDPAQFLRDVAGFCHTLRLTQHEHKRKADNCNYFFGLEDGDWAKIIRKMFRQKLSTLRIVNTSYTDYLPLEARRKLETKLSQSEKLLWFAGTSEIEDATTILDSVQREFIITHNFDRANGDLKIVHQSRVEEDIPREGEM